MRTVLLALATVAAGTALNVGAAQAQNYPFCLKYDGGGPGDCKYVTYEQCQASASGIRAYCEPNYLLPQSTQGYAPHAPRAGRAYGYGPQY